jgi:undecaprenyl-diphosphatase
VSTSVPSSVRAAVSRFDDLVESRVKPLRGNPVADRVFYTASELGDFGLIWVVFACLRALRSRRLDERAAIRAIAATGIESVLVNVMLKSLFGRGRPLEQLEHPLPLRQPLSSSFPSGHSTAAFCAATLLSDGDPAWPVYIAAATLVAASRVYVRIHHASDVAGGVFVGLALGQIGKAIVPLEGRRHRRDGGRRARRFGARGARRRRGRR